MEASKKKMKFPSAFIAFSLLFFLLLLVLLGLFPQGPTKASYDTTENHFIVKTHGILIKAATEQTLNSHQNSTF